MHATTRAMKLLPPAYFRSAPFHALSCPTAHRVYRHLTRGLSGPLAAATVQSALLANLLKLFITIYHGAGLVSRSSLVFHSNAMHCADMHCSTGDYQRCEWVPYLRPHRLLGCPGTA